MNSFSIKYQTSDLVPPPFAHAIEINGKIDKNSTLLYEFEITYLGREDLTEDEILGEGFSLNDDFSIKGSLPKVWTDHLSDLLKATNPLYLKEINDTQDYWQIESGDKPFYPAKTERWKTFLEEFQQAAYEDNQWEAPLKIKILRLGDGAKERLTIKGSFLNRKLETEVEINQEKNHKTLKFTELDNLLRKVYGGEYLMEKADKKAPSKMGIYVNLGDEIWFEVGKSLMIQPKKLTSLFEN
ncbi:hypothetical protein GVN16_22165 [Emticicia sp. CRIBPO]|jgi:hypothetical protein|uniref:hypothetical protein n=1 Tax=Emticicia sp. CRIBPO TaxID=2683258 RepID=UPI001411BEA3|nr:hypothetical protein [Emticicia sp. CRIBPO]NBA88495.1 hypothetical protein [Emticicia sp. CRIBPO]